MRSALKSSVVLLAAVARRGLLDRPGASPSASAAASRGRVAASAPPRRPPRAPSADACAKDSLTTVTAGKLTIGTDNPAYPPYFQIPDGTATEPWELGDPTNGEGFEGAFAYALADQLGFAKADVAWVVVPFDNSFAPGAKTFDIDINQVSFKPERAEAADLSDGYYTLNQSIVALKDNGRRRGQDDRRPQGLQVRRPDRDDELRHDQRRHRSDGRGDGLQHATTTRSRASRPSRSTASSSTCRPRSSSPPPRSRTRSSSASSRRPPAPTPSTSASSSRRTAR